MIRYDKIQIAYDRTLVKNGTMELRPGTLNLVKAPSGSGKTALLYRLALIVNDCRITVEGKPIRKVERFRREQIAFVSQESELIACLCVRENLEEAALIGGCDYDEAAYAGLLETVGLDVPFAQRASELSVGERQRLAIACALAKNTPYIILDEPTAALDPLMKIEILALLKKISEEGRCVVFSSHEDASADMADVIYTLMDGDIVKIQDNGISRPVFQASHHFRPVRFLFKHIRHYAVRNQAMMILANMLLIFSLVMNVLLSWRNETAFQHAKETLFQATDRLLYVTNASNVGYLDEDTAAFIPVGGYPVYNAKCDGIPLVPLFDNRNLNNRVMMKLDTAEDGMYASYRVYESWHGELKDTMQLIVQGSLARQIDVTYAGIYKSGATSSLVRDDTFFLSCPYVYLPDQNSLFVQTEFPYKSKGIFLVCPDCFSMFVQTEFPCLSKLNFPVCPKLFSLSVQTEFPCLSNLNFPVCPNKIPCLSRLFFPVCPIEKSLFVQGLIIMQIQPFFTLFSSTHRLICRLDISNIFEHFEIRFNRLSGFSSSMDRTNLITSFFWTSKNIHAGCCTQPAVPSTRRHPEMSSRSF